MNPSSISWNALWGRWIVEELVRNDIGLFCVSPGSRSAPLTVAVAENPRARSEVFIDERSAAYFALGYARATGRAAALIATSGSAVANYLPAVIEASMDHVPMLVLTADRPPELHDCGANQTIEQDTIFGTYVRWFHNPGCPGPEMPGAALLSMLDYAVKRTQTPLPGPVHLNFPFREPFFEQGGRLDTSGVPDGWQSSETPYVRRVSAQKLPEQEALDALFQDKPERGILSVGRIPAVAQPAVKQLAQALNWPLFADIASGLRLGMDDSPQRIAHYDTLLSVIGNRDAWQPEAIWHLGFPPLSKCWLTFLEKSTASQRVWIAEHPLRQDPTHRFTWCVESDLDAFCRACIARLSDTKSASSDWLERWQALEKQTATLMGSHFDAIEPHAPIPSEAHLARSLSQWVPSGQGFFIGNSLPVRMVDTYGSDRGSEVRIAMNRGTSGIDGLIASAPGYACGLQRPVTLLIGDLSTLHDLNSLSLLKSSPFPIVLVLCNNHGGGIFSFLPIAKQRPEVFEKFFGTPHQLDFKAVSSFFDLDYSAADTLAAFKQHYTEALTTQRSTIIEVAFERSANVVVQEHWQNSLLNHLQRSSIEPVDQKETVSYWKN